MPMQKSSAYQQTEQVCFSAYARALNEQKDVKQKEIQLDELLIN